MFHTNSATKSAATAVLVTAIVLYDISVMRKRSQLGHVTIPSTAAAGHVVMCAESPATHQTYGPPRDEHRYLSRNVASDLVGPVVSLCVCAHLCVCHSPTVHVCHFVSNCSWSIYLIKNSANTVVA